MFCAKGFVGQAQDEGERISPANAFELFVIGLGKLVSILGSQTVPSQKMKMGSIANYPVEIEDDGGFHADTCSFLR